MSALTSALQAVLKFVATPKFLGGAFVGASLAGGKGGDAAPPVADSYSDQAPSSRDSDQPPDDPSATGNDPTITGAQLTRDRAGIPG